MNIMKRGYGSKSIGKVIVVGTTKRDDLREATDIEILSGSGAVFGNLKGHQAANFRAKAAEGILVEISKLKERSI